jgi:hypothetical protein
MDFWSKVIYRIEQTDFCLLYLFLVKLLINLYSSLIQNINIHGTMIVELTGGGINMEYTMEE